MLTLYRAKVKLVVCVCIAICAPGLRIYYIFVFLTGKGWKNPITGCMIALVNICRKERISMQNPKGCWRMCIAATIALFCTIGLNMNAFSVYIPYLTKLLELTPNQSSAFLLVRNLCSVAALLVARHYYNKLDIRLGFTLALVLNTLSVFLYAKAQNFIALCFAAATNGLSYGIGGLFPVALLLHRWFRSHEGLAMGICSASSGLALTICAPILTFLIETRSMVFAMYCEIGFMVLCLLVCFCLIRNYPEEGVRFERRQMPNGKRAPINLMTFAIGAFGMLGGAFNFLTLHYTTESFDPYRISVIISVIGLTLTVSQFLLGSALDKFGAYRTNWVFLPMAIAGCIGFSVGAAGGYATALISACLFGIGDAVVTVGVSTYATDLSTPETFSSLQQQFQTAKLVGSLTCSAIPGLIATATGNYRLFYVIITVLTLFTTIVVQSAYSQKRKTQS